MGLMLSILVFSVGVVEALACVRHVQRGILPWAPHHVIQKAVAGWRESTGQEERDPACAVRRVHSQSFSGVSSWRSFNGDLTLPPEGVPQAGSSRTRRFSIETLQEHQAAPLSPVPEPSFARESQEPRRTLKPAKASSFEEASFEYFHTEPYFPGVTDQSTVSTGSLVVGRIQIRPGKESADSDHGNEVPSWPIVNIDTVFNPEDDEGTALPSNLGSRRVSFDPVPTVVVIDKRKSIVEEKEFGILLSPSIQITDDWRSVLRKAMVSAIDEIITEAVLKVGEAQVQPTENAERVVCILKGISRENKDKSAGRPLLNEFAGEYQDGMVNSLEANHLFSAKKSTSSESNVSPLKPFLPKQDSIYDTFTSEADTPKKNAIPRSVSEKSSLETPKKVNAQINKGGKTDTTMEIRKHPEDVSFGPKELRTVMKETEIIAATVEVSPPEAPLVNSETKDFLQHVQEPGKAIANAESRSPVLKENLDAQYPIQATRMAPSQMANIAHDKKSDQPEIAIPTSAERDQHVGTPKDEIPTQPVQERNKPLQVGIVDTSFGEKTISKSQDTSTELEYSVREKPNVERKTENERSVLQVETSAISKPGYQNENTPREITTSQNTALVIQTKTAPKHEIKVGTLSEEVSKTGQEPGDSVLSSEVKDSKLSAVTPSHKLTPEKEVVFQAIAEDEITKVTKSLNENVRQETGESRENKPISGKGGTKEESVLVSGSNKEEEKRGQKSVEPAERNLPAKEEIKGDVAVRQEKCENREESKRKVEAKPQPKTNEPTNLRNEGPATGERLKEPTRPKAASGGETNIANVPEAESFPEATSPGSASDVSYSSSTSTSKSPSSSDSSTSRKAPSRPPQNSTQPPQSDAFWLIFSGEYTKAMSKDWHSGHFCCWQCDESLTGQRYILRDEHPYCIKCYESVFANVCEECNRIIGVDSKDLSYKDKHWHELCFLCTKCRVSLVDKQFGSKADKIYCGNCYDAQFASRCDGCGEIFRAGTKKMEYKTRQWHEKCFCCCVCKTPIGTKSFIPREQEIYCAGCYEEKFATRCVKCNKIITSGGVTYKNEPWHRECFTCTHCNTSLAGQRFTSRDEKPYCADCFGELFAKRCTACSKPITGIGGTRFISFEDRHWHNDCFICASCKTSLVGRGFITDAEDIICPECAKQKLM